MSEYYLISQLPSLDGISENSPIPITEERFLDLCGRLLDEKVFSEIESITLVPSIEPKESNYTLIESWNTAERDLRLALGKARADRMNKSFDLQNSALSAELNKVANSALEIDNPLEAENFLLRYRLSFLETLRPLNPFSVDFILYYAIKLKLILRIRQFDATLGETAYKNIYSSILNGDRLEA